MNSYVDVRDALGRIRAPTLVLHRRGDRDFHPEEGRYLADRIPGASFVLLEGDDHWPFVGDSSAVLDAVERFAASLPEPPRAAAPGKPRRPQVDPLDALTPKQREILEFVAQGRSNKQIAAQLGLSEHTVHRRIADLRARLGVSTRAAAAALFAERTGR
jgi:DNA-binding CsgD family transcriptional regulator